MKLFCIHEHRHGVDGFIVEAPYNWSQQVLESRLQELDPSTYELDRDDESVVFFTMEDMNKDILDLR